MSDRTAFGPSEIDAMSAAFRAALGDVADETRADLAFNAHSLRRRLAAGVVAAAKEGIVDVEMLTEEALRALRELG